MNRQRWAALLALTIMLTGLVFLHYREQLDEFPRHIHAWTQSDRLALALGFLDNGMDFFHPQTLNLKPDPASERVTAITAVDFPVYEYCVAILMKATGSTSPMVFRLFTLTLSLVSLFFLYRLATLVAGNVIAGVFAVAFCATAPVYLYYQPGFLPTLNSLSVFIIGLYFYFRYLHRRDIRAFYTAAALLAIAAAARTPFAVFLIAITVHRVLEYMNEARANRRELIALAAAFVFTGGYFLFNLYLRSVYNSAFLGTPMPAGSLQELYVLVVNARRQWMYHYLTHYHYFALIVLMLTTMLRNLNGIRAGEAAKNMFTLTAIAFAGTAAYAILMARQFADHDYYFLETFFPVSIMLVSACLGMLPYHNKPARYATLILVVVFVFFAVQSGQRTLEKRYETGNWDRVERTRLNFEHADTWLDNAGVGAGDHILVIDAYTTNSPLIFMRRKGFTVLNTTGANVKKALDLPYDYVVMQNEFILSDVVRNYPEIVHRLTLIESNGKLSLYRQDPDPGRPLATFLGLPGEPKFERCLHFGTPSPGWITASGVNTSAPGKLDENAEYSATLEQSTDFLNGQPSTLLFEGAFLSTADLNGLDLVVSAHHGNEQVYYASFVLQDYLEPDGKWVLLKFLFPLPALPAEGALLKVYVWNHGLDQLLYDHWCVNIY